jgi:hypothetical protein
MFPYDGTDPSFVDTLEHSGQELGFGVNYMNGHWLKLQADWIARMPYDFEMDVATQVVHVQLDATF